MILGTSNAVAIAGLGWWIYQESFAGFEPTTPVTYQAVNLDEDSLYPTEIVGAPEIPKVATSVVDFHGKPVTVACAVCHTTREPNRSNTEAVMLDEFHQGLTYQHGGVSCLSCHNEDNYDTLRLADGTSVEFPNAMQLCAQCHGPQYRDYLNGSHGGMNGFWDRQRGPRVRNACNVCHDPHAPAYPKLIPVFPPRDVPMNDADHKSSTSH